MRMADEQILRGKSAICEKVNEKTRLFLTRRNACKEMKNNGCQYENHRCVYRKQPRYGTNENEVNKVNRNSNYNSSDKNNFSQLTPEEEKAIREARSPENTWKYNTVEVTPQPKYKYKGGKKKSKITKTKSKSKSKLRKKLSKKNKTKKLN